MALSEYTAMLSTAGNAGLVTIPARRQYQLLALLHLYGDEPFVFNERLRIDTQYAARKNGFLSCSMPDREAIRAISRCEAEIKSGVRPAWFEEIEARYGITIPTWSTPQPCKWEELHHARPR